MTDTNPVEPGDVAEFEISESEMRRYLDGKVELRELLESDAELLAKRKGRAQFFIDGGHDERAVIMLEMLEELDRTDRTATLLAVEILLKLGLSDRAEEKVHALLERDAGDPDARVARAQLDLSTGRWYDAAATLQSVIDEDPEFSKPATQRASVLAQAAHERFESSR